MSTSHQIDQLLAQFAGMSNLRFAAILKADGTFLKTVGEHAREPDGLARDLATLRQLARSLCSRFENGAYKSVIVEADQGTCLLCALTADHSLLLVAHEQMFLGKARLLLGKLQEPLRAALGGG